MHFFESWFIGDFNKESTNIQLSSEESSHLSKSFRLTCGTKVQVCNGEGLVADCTISISDKHASVLEIDEIKEFTQKPKVHLALGWLKHKSPETVVEACCQLNIASIQFLITQHTQIPKGKSFKKELQRLITKSESALKQCRKPWLTQIKAPLPIEQWVQENNSSKIVLDLNGQPLQNFVLQPHQDIWIVSGPEGGFSNEEIQNIMNSGPNHILTLGETRIRAAHASAFALGAVQSQFPELFRL